MKKELKKLYEENEEYCGVIRDFKMEVKIILKALELHKKGIKSKNIK